VFASYKLTDGTFQVTAIRLPWGVFSICTLLRDKLRLPDDISHDCWASPSFAVFDSLCVQSGCSPSVSRRSCLLREAALDLVENRSNLRGQSVKTRARGSEGPKRQRVSLRSVVHTSDVFATLLAKCCPEEPEESPFRSTGPLGKGQALVLKTKSCSSAPWGDRQMTKENGPHCRRLDHWAVLQQQHAMTI
jgi:hypothetical protein